MPRPSIFPGSRERDGAEQTSLLPTPQHRNLLLSGPGADSHPQPQDPGRSLQLEPFFPRLEPLPLLEESPPHSLGLTHSLLGIFYILPSTSLPATPPAPDLLFSPFHLSDLSQSSQLQWPLLHLKTCLTQRGVNILQVLAG